MLQNWNYFLLFFRKIWVPRFVEMEVDLSKGSLSINSLGDTWKLNYVSAPRILRALQNIKFTTNSGNFSENEWAMIAIEILRLLSMDGWPRLQFNLLMQPFGRLRRFVAPPGVRNEVHSVGNFLQNNSEIIISVIKIYIEILCLLII